jgi:hypothetical protein
MTADPETDLNSEAEQGTVLYAAALSSGKRFIHLLVMWRQYQQPGEQHRSVLLAAVSNGQPGNHEAGGGPDS